MIGNSIDQGEKEKEGRKGERQKVYMDVHKGEELWRTHGNVVAMRDKLGARD